MMFYEARQTLDNTLKYDQSYSEKIQAALHGSEVFVDAAAGSDAKVCLLYCIFIGPGKKQVFALVRPPQRLHCDQEKNSGSQNLSELHDFEKH